MWLSDFSGFVWSLQSTHVTHRCEWKALNTDWFHPTDFWPLTFTATLGPPLVSLTGCGNCLLLKLSPPVSVEQNHDSLAYFYREYTINVSRTRDKAQVSLACCPESASSSLMHKNSHTTNNYSKYELKQAMPLSVRRWSQLLYFLLAVSCTGYCTLHDTYLD